MAAHVIHALKNPTSAKRSECQIVIPAAEKMKLDAKDFRVPSGKKIKLSKWPTVVKPVYTSKQEYQKLLEKHVTEF